jgi:hypothetical protein
MASFTECRGSAFGERKVLNVQKYTKYYYILQAARAEANNDKDHIEFIKKIRNTVVQSKYAVAEMKKAAAVPPTTRAGSS